MRIDQAWPATELEQVEACPYCASVDREMAYAETQDWTFDSAPGRWSYWRCLDCSALYLSPRPDVQSIGRAYARYYTHDNGSLPFLAKLKRRLVNECLSHGYRVDLNPRLSLPRSLSWLLYPFRRKFVVPFGFESLVRLPKGRLLDVGCGSGSFLGVGQQLGWDCFGLELDPAAVKAARQRGLNVEEAAYDRLAQYPECFDSIVCSHVLEHVHTPLDLLDKLNKALKPGGTLLLSAPNAMSKASDFLGPYWRGLEAPRHLAIPTAAFLREYLGAMGFHVLQQGSQNFPTIAESLQIKQKALSSHDVGRGAVKRIRKLLGKPTPDQVDFIELICVKPLASHDDGHDPT